MLALASGCGRFGFTARTGVDSGGGDDAAAAIDGVPLAIPALVQIKSRANFASGTAQPITATQAGNLLIVAIDINSGTDTIASVTDDAGDAFVSANVQATSIGNPGGDVVADIWYAAVTAGGATQLAVTTSAGAALWDATVLEVSGTSPTAPIDVAAAASNLPGATAAGNGVPLATTRDNAAVVTLNSGSRLTGLVAGSAFQKLTTGANDDVAYLFGAHPAGTYEADWTCNVTCGVYNVSAVAFAAR
jgi:hypothetical protein